MKRTAQHTWRDGLTLLELLVVIAILGLVTATVTSRLGNTLGPAALEQSIAQWKFTDEQLRSRARRSGKPTALEIDLGTNRLECAFDVEPAASRTRRTLSRGVQITKYISPTREVSLGQLSINFDAVGGSETFVIEFRGRGEVRRWMLVAGFTGQITEIKDENAARDLLQALCPPGVHAG